MKRVLNTFKLKLIFLSLFLIPSVICSPDKDSLVPINPLLLQSLIPQLITSSQKSGGQSSGNGDGLLALLSQFSGPSRRSSSSSSAAASLLAQLPKVNHRTKCRPLYAPRKRSSTPAPHFIGKVWQLLLRRRKPPPLPYCVEDILTALGQGGEGGSSKSESRALDNINIHINNNIPQSIGNGPISTSTTEKPKPKQLIKIFGETEESEVKSMPSKNILPYEPLLEDALRKLKIIKLLTATRDKKKEEEEIQNQNQNAKEQKEIGASVENENVPWYFKLPKQELNASDWNPNLIQNQTSPYELRAKLFEKFQEDTRFQERNEDFIIEQQEEPPPKNCEGYPKFICILSNYIYSVFEKYKIY